MIDLILLYATPVALAALGEVLSQRAGMLNIGLEGLMLTGAFAGAMVTNATHNPWLGLAAGVAATVLAGVFQAVFTVWLALDQVVIGTALNLTALGITSTWFRTAFGRSGTLMSLPALPHFGRIDPVVGLLLVLLVIAVWIPRTSWGLRVRASGENPEALEVAGFSVLRLRFQVVLLASALAGLGGAHLAIGIGQSFAENMVSGRGYMAIAMVTFGRWHPVKVVLACLLVAFAEALQFFAQTAGLALRPQVFLAMPYVLALAVLVIVGRGQHSPAALGVPYRRTN